MPNWAMGDVTVTGTKAGVTSFVSRFVADDASKTVPGKKYFARSFLETQRSCVLSEIPTPAAEDDIISITFSVSFAWSAHTCLVSGYPQQFAGTCISLEDACVEDQVDVEIHTTEFGMGFEEHIRCSAFGELEADEDDMRRAICSFCDCIQSICSDEDIAEMECPECGHVGFEEVD